MTRGNGWTKCDWNRDGRLGRGRGRQHTSLLAFDVSTLKVAELEDEAMRVPSQVACEPVNTAPPESSYMTWPLPVNWAVSSSPVLKLPPHAVWAKEARGSDPAFVDNPIIDVPAASWVAHESRLGYASAASEATTAMCTPPSEKVPGWVER